MTFPDVDIVNRSTARELLRRRMSAIPHVVSISDPQDGPPAEVEDHPQRTLALTFHDISERRGNLVMPTRRDVLRIVKFAEAMEPGEYVMCHCNAGISRSSAAALTIFASKMDPGPRSAQQAVTEVMRVKSIIHPNRAMVAFADDILGYGGALVDAHASTFEGGVGFWVPPE